MSYFCEKLHTIIMTTTRPIPAAARYWDIIKDSSNEVKLNLITLLSASLQEDLKEEKSEDEYVRCLSESVEDIKYGRVYTEEELESEELEKMPWLAD